ncbi:hypothetical protein FHR83_006807 [Actinoplanes campanulatus]|uniref:Uncharacterized protein n=1 Tax=Actinoplanes campanulatus TaxID=113559 RepID=A0A7W5FHX5_9ACTN|nr:hypothetical protein [Actinoplanes campanulatus]MBB3099101.1 hypothetical protein [Actinoplanes campanulatus]GGN39054.1 hypothetical protein GCM10010109_66520 [Actinoplanes campanulatus]GID40257.1 hypothetical protein Aca09nite_67630 [Actinoplanes campanulatus]
MRLKTATTRQLKPGMVIRSQFALGGAPFRQVATITKPTPWAERLITFTDGTEYLASVLSSFDIATSKHARHTAIRCATYRPTAFDVLTAMFRAYAAA